MTTKKREVYQFLAMTVNPIQNYVSYVMKKPGSETGTSKARHVLRLVKPATQLYHQGSRFVCVFPSLHPPAHCAGFTEGCFSYGLKMSHSHWWEKGRNFWNCSRRRRTFPETSIKPSLFLTQDSIGHGSFFASSIEGWINPWLNRSTSGV